MEFTDSLSLQRSLRHLTLLAAAITFPLGITATVLSLQNQHWRWARRHVTAFCFVFVPLTLTIIASSVSLQYMSKHGKRPQALPFKILDLVAVFAYFAVLVPCWAVELREFNLAGFGLLVGYTTAGMILNMFIHGYFTVNGIPFKKLFGCIRRNNCQQCPNCQAKFLPGKATQVETTTKKGYSLLRGEDYLDVEADPIQYRDSEDFLGEGAERAEQSQQSQPEQAKAAESDNGKEMVEV